MNKYQQEKIKKSFKRRASIEPIIGHLKFDHRLSRNFYKGLFGDGINVLLAAAFNFKRMMRKWKASIFNFFPEITNYFFIKLQNLFFLKFLKLNF
jgi:IS5 family transposase